MTTDWTAGIKELFGTARPEVSREYPAMSGTGNNPKYAEAALQAECETVASTAAYRNDQLNLSAFKIGGYVGANELPERVAREALIQAGLAAGLEPGEVPGTVDSGLRKGKLKPTPAPIPAPRAGLELGPTSSSTPRSTSDEFPGSIVSDGPPKPPKARLRVRTAATIETKRVRWLWHNRIPLGEICLIAGRESVGKSTYLADLAAKITRGEAKGEFEGEPRSVIYLAQEDSWSYTVVPRMMAAGANLDRIIQIEAIEGEDGLMLPKDCNEVAEIALEVGAAAIMCDPIISLIDDRLSTDRTRELRKALEPLRRAAERADCAVPALVHFNKGDGDILTKIAGARGWPEVARAVIGLAQDKENGYCVLSQVKTNLGAKSASNWSYVIESFDLRVSDGSMTNVGKIRWLDKVDQSVEDILAVAKVAQSGPGRPLQAETQDVINFVVDSGEVDIQTIKSTFMILGDKKVENILSNAVNRGDLQRLGRGVYGPPSEV